MQPIKDGLFFTFIDETSNSAFTNSASNGIIMVNGAGAQADVARWAKVVAVGPDCRDVHPGDEVLVEAGMWTVAFENSGQRQWKTDESKLIVVRSA